MSEQNEKRPRIGTASWNIPADARHYFPIGNSLLERYSQVFNAVEINSSFYRSHKKMTYERWAAVTPHDFQFAVKMPKEITHKYRLVNIENYLSRFLNEINGLQNKLGPVLIQLPPSLCFEPIMAINFFKQLRNKYKGKAVLEPRHISWAELEAITLCKEYSIEIVIADPVKVPIKTYGEESFKYYRLHGSPEIYTSAYSQEYLKQLTMHITDSSWVFFDNTKYGAATHNALNLKNFYE